MDLLRLVAVELPSWGLAVDGIDQTRITILSEWISHELGLLDKHLLASCEAALCVTKPQKSCQIIVFEVDGEEKLRLKICWRLTDVGRSELRILVIEDFYLILSKLVTPDEGINIHWIPIHMTSMGISDLALRE